MNSKRIISIIIIALGIGLVIFGLTSNSNNKKESETTKEEPVRVHHTKEETALSWIGQFKDGKDNEINILIHDYDKYELLLMYHGSEVLVELNDIDYYELKGSSESLDVVLTKENDIVKANIKSKNEDMSISINEETEFHKNNDDNWSGVYKLNDNLIFITYINDAVVNISYVNNNKNENNLILIDEEKNDLLSEKVIEYSFEDEKFILEKENDILNFNYTGNNNFYKELNGIYQK